MIIAIDVGGTKTLITTFSTDGTMGALHRLTTQRSTERFLQDIFTVLDTFAIGAQDIISVAAAGLINHETGSIIHSPNLGWTQFPLKKELAQRYNCPVLLDNDANAGALGAAKAFPEIPPIALYITFGTGIGGGLVINGQLDDALCNIEIGHMVFETPNGLTTWEELASGRAIERDFNRAIHEITDPEMWEVIADRIIVGLRVLIPALQPNLILIGGGVGAHFELVADIVNQKLSEQLPPYIPQPPIVKAQTPETAVLSGCYHHALAYR